VTGEELFALVLEQVHDGLNLSERAVTRGLAVDSRTTVDDADRVIGEGTARRMRALAAALASVLLLTAVCAASAGAAANLTLKVTDAPDPATPDDTLAVTATVKNEGDTEARDATLTFGAPDNAQLAGASNCNIFILVICSLGSQVDPETEERIFPPGATATYTITYNKLQIGEIDIQINLSHAGIASDPPPNDFLSKTTVEPRADLKIDMNAATPVTIGNTSTVTATVTNTLNGPARGTLLQLIVPPELPIASLPAGCGASGLRISCDLGLIDPQGTAQRAFVFQVPTEGSFIVIGNVTWSKPDPTPADAQWQSTITGLSPVEPDGGAPPPATPASKPALAKPQDVPIKLFTSGLASGKRCIRTRTLRFKLKRPSGVPLTGADVYIGSRRVKRISGVLLRRTVVLTKLPRARYKVTVVVSLRDGGRLRGRRTLKACR
jgi:hypothetical protein